MEAALRTAADILDGPSNRKIEFKEVRGTDGIKEATYSLGGKTIRVAVVSGLANARIILDSIKSGEKKIRLCGSNGLSGRMYKRRRSACSRRQHKKLRGFEKTACKGSL